MKTLLTLVLLSSCAWAQSHVTIRDASGNVQISGYETVDPVVVSVSPQGMTVLSDAPLQFSATVANSLNGGVSWTSSLGEIDAFGNFSMGALDDSQVLVTATSLADPTKSATATVAVKARAGCGAGPGGVALGNQNACGNYAGAPYEDLNVDSRNTVPAPVAPGTLHLISACTTISAPKTGDVYRFSANINDGAGGTNQNCIHFAGQSSNNFLIDLAGFSLTGGMNFDQSLGGNGIDGITVVNGTIACNIANGGNRACLMVNQGGNPKKSFMLSHLTVNNLNSPAAPDAAVVTVQRPGGYFGFEFAVLLTANGTTDGTCLAGQFQKTFNGACLEIVHSDINEAFGYTGTPYTSGWCARCTALGIFGNGAVTAEVWNSQFGNGNGWIDAHQAIVFFHTGLSNAHNNYFPFVAYLGSSDNGREILYDCAGKGFCNTGGIASNNLHEVFNNRAIRTRQVNGVVTTNSRFEHVSGSIVTPAIMEGGNGDYAEKLDKNVVSHDTFTMAGGVAIESAESYGMIADGNSFLCDSSCSAGNLSAAWVAEGVTGLAFPIQSATRTAQCVVTLVMPSGGSPTTTSPITGLFVNIGGTSSSFDVSATAANTITAYNSSTRTITYTQAGCSGAASIGAVGNFWISQFSSDAFAGNGSAIYVKNSVVDPLLIMTQPFVACGTISPACQNTPQTTLNGGQTQIKACNNLKSAVNVPAVGGAGALVQNLTGTCP